MVNHYKTLQVKNFADEQTIKTAYRTLSKKYHPDINKDADPAIMVAINSAFDVLKDPVKKEAFDNELRMQLLKEKLERDMREAFSKESHSEKTESVKKTKETCDKDAQGPHYQQSSSKEHTARQTQYKQRSAEEQTSYRKNYNTWEEKKSSKAKLTAGDIIKAIMGLGAAVVFGYIATLVLMNLLNTNGTWGFLIYIAYGVFIGGIVKEGAGIDAPDLGSAAAIVCILTLMLPYYNFFCETLYLYNNSLSEAEVAMKGVLELAKYIFDDGIISAIKILMAPLATKVFLTYSV